MIYKGQAYTIFACLKEKLVILDREVEYVVLHIIFADKGNELVTKCSHKNKLYVVNHKKTLSK